MRQSVHGTIRNTRSELPRALARSRSSADSPDRVADPVNPNIFSASFPTSGAAHAARAPSKHLQEHRASGSIHFQACNTGLPLSHPKKARRRMCSSCLQGLSSSRDSQSHRSFPENLPRLRMQADCNSKLTCQMHTPCCAYLAALSLQRWGCYSMAPPTAVVSNKLQGCAACRTC